MSAEKGKAAPQVAHRDKPTGVSIPADPFHQTPTSEQAKRFAQLHALNLFRVNTTAHVDAYPTLVINARHCPANPEDPDLLFDFFLHVAGPYLSSPYTVLLVNTCATWGSNSPGLWWLCRAYSRLGATWRDNCLQIFVLHCDISLWLAVSLAGPVLAWEFWNKVEWVARIELLKPAFHVRECGFEAEVVEHDERLEGQALLDFGLVA